MPETPFDSIESAHEYVGLLRDQIAEVRAALAKDLGKTEQVSASRRLEALRLVDYKLSHLHEHMASSSRILNDLRALRRLLLGDR